MMKNYSENLLNPYIIDCNYITKDNHSWPVGILYNRRIVRFYEVELITGGSGKIYTNRKLLEASKGDIFIRKPGSEVQGISGYYFCTIIFDAVYNKTREDIYNTNIPYWLTGENQMLPYLDFFDFFPDKIRINNFNKYLQPFLNIYNKNSQTGINKQLYMKADLLKILAMLREELDYQSDNLDKQSIKNNYSKVMECKNYIDINISTTFSLDMLAEISGLSRTFFCRIFRQIVGKSPFEYIIDQKLSLAKILLSTTNISIKEISVSCGFNDITYFYRVFKRKFNTTPKLYRENMCKL